MASFRSIHSANREVDELRRIVKAQFADISRFWKERRTLAKLAAKGPCFNNPLDAMAAETLRDQILHDECGLNPDGTHVLTPRP